jgi:hypothetical protein
MWGQCLIPWSPPSFNVKGKSAHDGPISGSVSTTISRDQVRISHVNGKGKIEGKYTDKATGERYMPEINASFTG